MAMFRKKPVVIEAWQFDGSWSSARPIINQSSSMAWSDSVGGQIAIETLEGTMTASAGDWIIKGVKDELYPCKPDIFELTYLPAGELDPQEVSRAQTAIALHLIECQATTTEVAIAVGACLAEKALRAAHGENRP